MNGNLEHIRIKASDAISIVLAVIMVVLTVVACSSVSTPKDEPTPTFAEVNDLPAPPSQVTFFAAGDILAHDLLAAQGHRSDGSYDYSFLFANMADEIASYDIASITQETPLVDDDSQVSGYPTFGTPCQMADAIAEAGFDVVISATNHSYDKGVYGLETTMSYWKNNHPEITVLGIHDTPKEADGVSFVRSNGIEIAMAEFTYDLNGFVLPEGKEYRDLYTYICEWDF